MLYPVYVHPGDADHAHGVTLPDFPGCFSAADDWQALPGAVQEAVELYCEGGDVEIPTPSALEALAHHPDYQGGVWMLLDIDLQRLRPTARRLNVSLPDALVRRIDAHAKARHMSRSAFLARAAAEAIARDGA
jgi:predicted RNase H-like HicB family nuclease